MPFKALILNKLPDLKTRLKEVMMKANYLISGECASNSLTFEKINTSLQDTVFVLKF